MLQFLIKRCLLKPVLDLFKDICENGLRWIFTFKFIDHFKERCPCHPVVDSNRVVEITSLDCAPLDIRRGKLGSTLADHPKMHDVMHGEITEEQARYFKNLLTDLILPIVIYLSLWLNRQIAR